MARTPINLVMFRKMRNMTQYELATQVGSTQPQISLLETGDLKDLTLLEQCKQVLKFPGEAEALLEPYEVPV